MRWRFPSRLALALGCCAVGCAPSIASDPKTDATTGDEPPLPSSTGTDGTTSGTTGSTTIASTSTISHGTDGTSLGSGFIVDPDGSVRIECSLWDQDCPSGEKCMPWANDADASWNRTRCTPIAPDPDQPGDPCTVEDSPYSGVDSCDISAMCWYVDPETNEGTCVAFCSGSENDPVCSEPDTRCNLNGSGVLILCIPTCDPLAQDCGAGQACVGTWHDFVCVWDASGDAGAYGDPCQHLDACDPGLECGEAAWVPGCAGDIGCCTPYCDLGAGEPCPGEGQVCIPYFDPMAVPSGYENVGICAIPS